MWFVTSDIVPFARARANLSELAEPVKAGMRVLKVRLSFGQRLGFAPRTHRTYDKLAPLRVKRPGFTLRSSCTNWQAAITRIGASRRERNSSTPRMPCLSPI